MKVSKTRKGNAKIILSMAELEDLKTLLNNSHLIGRDDAYYRGLVKDAERVSQPLCHAIVGSLGVTGK